MIFGDGSGGVRYSTADNKQVGGQHYKAQAIQHWTYVLANNIPYMEAQVLKYVSRHRLKGGEGDLRKAQHFIEKLISWEQEHPGQERPEVPENYPHLTDWVRGISSPTFNVTLDEVECIHLVRFWRRGNGTQWLEAAHRLIDKMVETLAVSAAEPQPHGYVDQE
jgi:hypothetical protein